MKSLKERSAQDGIAHHISVPPRIYENCGLQKDRIDRARAMVEKALEGQDQQIIELGCGTGDICGHFSARHRVHGFDCNEESLRVARERFPMIYGYHEISEPVQCDTLILCEFLEHVPDPISVVTGWLPLAKSVVISHPLNGDLNGDMSGGDHQWSYDENDFKNWFSVGGHELVESETFQMGGYQIIIGRGKRIAQC